MISEEEVERAAQFIRDKSAAHAKAKAERIYMQEFRKSKKAMLVLTQTGTIQEKDSYAYAHKEYLEILEAYRIAIEEEETLIWQIKAAQARLEIWRTQSANNRRIDSSHQ